MATIDTYLEDIKNKTYGEDIRDAIHDGIQQCYTDATDVVKVSDTPPTSENTKIWIKPVNEDMSVPTWEEHEELAGEVDDLKSALYYGLNYGYYNSKGDFYDDSQYTITTYIPRDSVEYVQFTGEGYVVVTCFTDKFVWIANYSFSEGKTVLKGNISNQAKYIRIRRKETNQLDFYHDVEIGFVRNATYAELTDAKNECVYGLVNGYMNTSGVFTEDTGYKCTDYIPIETIYAIEFATGSNGHIHCYDDTYTHLAHYSISPGKYFFSKLIGTAILAQTKYVRIWRSEANYTDFYNDVVIIPAIKKTYVPASWGYGYLNSEGVYSNSGSYCLSDPIPYNLVKSVKSLNGNNVHTHFFDYQMNHIKPAVTGDTVIPYISDCAYIRFWISHSDVSTIDQAIFIEYGSNCLDDLYVAMPSRIYMLSGVEYDLFKDNMVKLKDDCYYRIDCESVTTSTAKDVLNTDRGVYIKKPQDIPNLKLVSKSYDKKSGNIANSKTSDVIISTVSDDSAINVQVIGDSYTAMNPSWINYIIENNLCPGAQFVGLRENPAISGQYHEGRGGWELATYAHPSIGTGLTGDNYAGFWQPNGDYRYWGDIRFWVNAKNPTGYEYVVGGYDTSKFASDGYLLSPTTNDIMYNGTNYIKWNGTSWATVQETDYTWSFQYGKYLSMWGITAPDICAIMLGVNDFREEYTSAKWDSFKNRLDGFIESYQTAVPTGKFVVVVHNSNMGYSWNIGNGANQANAMRTVAEIQSMNMWEYRKSIIAEYDTQAKRDSGIYLCDAGIMVDGYYGYDIEEIKPFSTYVGEATYKVQTRNPHPMKAYPAMGLPFAAIIQYLKS